MSFSPRRFELYFTVFFTTSHRVLLFNYTGTRAEMQHKAPDLQCKASHCPSLGVDRVGCCVPNHVLPLARLNASPPTVAHLLCVLRFSPTRSDNVFFRRLAEILVEILDTFFK